MVTLDTGLDSTSKGSGRFTGYFPAKLANIVATTKTSKGGKEYTELAVDFDLGNDTIRKTWWRLPWDGWHRDGEEPSLYRRFIHATEMTTAEAGDIKNYKGKKVAVIIGPAKNFDGEWSIYEKDGVVKLSYGIVDFAQLTDDEDMIKGYNDEQSADVKKALEDIKSKKTTQPGFKSASVDTDANYF